MSAGIEHVSALEELGLEALRATWRDQIGPPPRLRSVDLLRRMLAWRLQERVLGGLDADSQKLLRARAAVSRGPKVEVGTRLVREFRGERHEALITEAGVRYRGTDYASLSELATRITGVRWNGPRFFGLRSAT